MAKKVKGPIVFKVIRARKEHRPEIDRLIRETKIGDGLAGESLANFFVAIVDGRVTGCAGMDFINRHAAVFTHCAVEKEYRRSGIGSALIQKRFERARKRGAKILSLITMYYHFRFYKKRGFRVTKRALLPDDIRGYEQFTADRYKKCAVLINDNF